MRKIYLGFAMAVLLLSACKQNFKKGEMGLEYKIIGEGSGPTLASGDYMQLQLRQFYNNGKTDSLLNDSRNTTGAIIQPFDSASVPPAFFKILSKLKKGDSLVLRQLTDSMFAQYPGSMPPYFKKGNHFVTYIRLLNIFKTAQQADSAGRAEYALMLKKDSLQNVSLMAAQDKELKAYFAKNNITNVSKAPQGTYVQIIQAGTGPLIDTTVVVSTNYTGKLMDGTMFDSNTDPSKGHVEPFNVNMTNDKTLGSPVITGWMEGLKLLNKGAKAKFYIPSPLAYGSRGAGSNIPPNSILIFDIEVANVLSKQAAKADVATKNRIQMEKINRYRDSVTKAKGDTSKKPRRTLSH